MTLRLSALAALILALAAPASAAAQDTRTEFSFGIVPQQAASQLARTWGPFLNELGSRTGIAFRFRTTKDMASFEACLAAGAFDFAYMNPMHYATYSEGAAYRAIAHQAGKRLKGVLVARADSDFTSITSLEGQEIAFSSPIAFGASILTRASLRRNSVSFTPAYVKSHDNVYRAVAAGLMAAGGGVTRTWNSVDPEIRAQLRIIYETEGYTPHAFAVHETVGTEPAGAVLQALLQISSDRPDLARGIGMSGFVAATDADWDDVRALDASGDLPVTAETEAAACPFG